MKPAALRRWLDQLKLQLPADPQIALQQLTDEQLRTALHVSAELFRQVKSEVVRRGRWDDFLKSREPL